MIKYDKRKLRESFLKKRLSFNIAEIYKNSQKICRNIKSLPQIENKKAIAAYFAVNNEPNLHEVIDFFLKAKKTVVVSAFFENLGKYKFVKLSTLENLKIGPYQIPQPSKLVPFDSENIDLALIPGLAFSEDGLRLGYGKGVYDKLMVNINTLKIGVCFDFQVIDNFTSENHDLRVDFIITEERIFKTRNF